MGVGWKWSVTADPLVVSLWAHVPLLSTDGTGGGTRIDIATPEAPLRLAADVTLRTGFRTAGLAFQGTSQNDKLLLNYLTQNAPN